MYSLGYYMAYSDIAIDGYYEGLSNGLLWDNGDEFDLPMTDNQYVILYSFDGWEFSATLKPTGIRDQDAIPTKAAKLLKPVNIPKKDNVEDAPGKVRR